MSAGIGWALWHHSKLYLQQFKEPVPGWMKGIDTPKRLRLIKLAISLGWCLPSELLQDDATEAGRTQTKRS
jgi:hypothetical protein